MFSLPVLPKAISEMAIAARSAAWKLLLAIKSNKPRLKHRSNTLPVGRFVVGSDTAVGGGLIASVRQKLF